MENLWEIEFQAKNLRQLRGIQEIILEQEYARERMDASRLPKIVKNYRPEGTHNRGRPKKRCHQC